MKFRYIAIALIISVAAQAADPPTPQPVTNDIRSATAQGLETFRANTRTWRHYFEDGGNKTDISSSTLTASFFKSTSSTSVIPGTVALVYTGTNGIVDVTYSAANLNQTPGDYLYGLTLTDAGGSVVTWQIGGFEIKPSPPTTGVNTSSFGETLNFGIFTQYLGTVGGPYRSGTGITFTANSDGSQTISSSTNIGSLTVDHTPTNYSSTGNTIDDHLLGIDAAFGDLIIGADVQGYHINLDGWASISTNGGVDESQLDVSINSSLDLADASLQAAAIGVDVQGYHINLDGWASISTNGGVDISQLDAGLKTSLGLADTSIQKDGSVPWTGTDDKGGQAVSNVTGISFGAGGALNDAWLKFTAANAFQLRASGVNVMEYTTGDEIKIGAQDAGPPVWGPNIRFNLDTLFIQGIDHAPNTSYVGVNTTNPTVQFEVNGTAKATLFEGSGASLTSLNAANLTNRIEYMSFVIYPTNAVYHITWAMPLSVPITLRKVFAYTDASTCTVDIVEGASNGVWTAFGTNNAAIVANTNEVWDTSWTDAAVAAGNRVGVKVVNFNSSCKNATIGIEYRR